MSVTWKQHKMTLYIVQWSEFSTENMLNGSSILFYDSCWAFFPTAYRLLLLVPLSISFHLRLMVSLRSCRFVNGSRRSSYGSSCKMSQIEDVSTVSRLVRKFCCNLSSSLSLFGIASYNYWHFGFENTCTQKRWTVEICYLHVATTLRYQALGLLNDFIN